MTGPSALPTWNITTHHNITCIALTQLTLLLTDPRDGLLSCHVPLHGLTHYYCPLTMGVISNALILPGLYKHTSSNIQHIITQQFIKNNVQVISNTLLLPQLSTHTPTTIWHDITPQVYQWLSAIAIVLILDKNILRCGDLSETQNINKGDLYCDIVICDQKFCPRHNMWGLVRQMKYASPIASQSHLLLVWWQSMRFLHFSVFLVFSEQNTSFSLFIHRVIMEHISFTD